MTILYFIIALGVLIFIHELGHFVMAKRAGVGVQVFSLGFGPRLIGFRYKETLYQLSALPLGGYVKLTGESQEAEDADDPRSFVKKGVGKRFSIVLAGPSMNLLLTLVMMPVVFMLGRPTPVYLEQPPVIQTVLPATPAAQAGLQVGDRVMAIEGKSTPDWNTALQTILISPGAATTWQLERAGKELTLPVTIGQQDKTQIGFVGIEPSYLAAENPTIDAVQKNGAAAQAGLQAGDRVVAIGNQSILTWSQMTELIQQAEGKPVKIKVRRGERELSVTLVPKLDRSMNRYLIGIQKDPRARFGEVVYKKYSIGKAIVEGSRESLRLAGLTFQVLGRLVTLQLSYKSLGGPVRIAQAAGSAAQAGWADFLYFMAFLSLQLGILNLLPIPVLDGGHAFFMLFEVIRRRPLSEKVQGIATQAGLFLLLFLMVAVTINDIDMVWGFRELLDKIRTLF